MKYFFSNNAVDFREFFTQDNLAILSKTCNDIEISQSDLYEALCHSSFLAVAYTEQTNQIIGIVQVLSDMKWSAVINFVHILEGYRGKGIGTYLMQTTMEHLSSIPCVYVAPNDMTIAHFYEKFGLKVVTTAGVLLR